MKTKILSFRSMEKRGGGGRSPHGTKKKINSDFLHRIHRNGVIRKRSSKAPHVLFASMKLFSLK